MSSLRVVAVVIEVLVLQLSIKYFKMYNYFLDGDHYGPDSVVGTKTDPLRDRTVLLLRFGKLLLGAESLVALCVEVVSAIVLGLLESVSEGPIIVLDVPES